MATKTTENHIRKYLLYLEDPNQLLDATAIDKAAKAVETADDPIAKLKAIAELEQAKTVDEAPLRAGFVEHVKPWAESTGVPVTALKTMRVPEDVLVEAGFEVETVTNGLRRKARSAQRAKAVPVEAIQAQVLKIKGKFGLADVATVAGGSPATVRKAVEELVADGRVIKLGPQTDYTGRGRAPVHYSVNAG